MSFSIRFKQEEHVSLVRKLLLYITELPPTSSRFLINNLVSKTDINHRYKKNLTNVYAYTVIYEEGKVHSYFQSICLLINYTVSTLLWFKRPSHKSNIYHTGSAIYMRKPEIPVGKSNGSRHSVWEASENMSCDLMRCSFSTIFFCNRSFPHRVKFYSFMFMHKISTRVVCVNSKHSMSSHSQKSNLQWCYRKTNGKQRVAFKMLACKSLLLA